MAESAEAIVKEIGVARARQSYREAVEAVLDAMEARFHAKSLGMLEGLLTAFLRDVIAREEGPAQSVSLTMDTQRGLPALQIAVMNGEHAEDAMNGRGGAVTNVLSAGLRFAALSRATRGAMHGFRFRPFLVLDEADCWLRFSRVSGFSDVVYQLARDLGMQILMISHHPAEMLKGYPVHLERETKMENGETVVVPKARFVPMNESASSIASAESNGGRDEDRLPDERDPRGFRSIRLIDFMAHADTTIPLHPHVTILSGDNDIGKSAVTEAFRAICYNDASDMNIRHGAAQSEVVLSLDAGEDRNGDGEKRTLHWIRVAKGAPKVRYVLKDENGTVLKETPSPKDVPDWARNLMGVDLLESDGKDPLDVQIGHQKSPVFLLDKTPSQRASILDMGRESQHLRRLRDQWKKQVDEDRRVIRDGEKRLSALRSALLVLEPLDDVDEAVNLYGAVHQRAVDRITAIRRKSDALGDLRRLLDATRLLLVFPALPELPDRVAWLRSTARWRLFASAESCHQGWMLWKTARMLGAGALPEPPVHATQALSRRASIRAESIPAQKRMLTWAGWSQPELPALPEFRAEIRASMAESARSLWSARRILQGASLVSVPGLENLRKKTEWIFHGYRMGSETQHLKKGMLDNEEALRAEELASQALRAEKESMLAEWGICPFCGHGHGKNGQERSAI